MCDRSKTLWITFNGEIYNFLELRSWLESQGVAFASRSDTEVLIYLYQLLGPQMLERIRGMFAFAIWNTKDSSLFIARDRLGIKPLFYTQIDGELRFASEIKALIHAPDVPRELDLVALDGFLAQRYVTAPRTLLKAVRQLLPGHYLTYRAGVLNMQRYWQLRADPRYTRLKPDEAIREVEAKLSSTIESHLIADVPYGALLSSGIDSATMVALLAAQHPQQVRTFTAQMKEESFSEGALARKIADALGAKNDQVEFTAPTPELFRKIVYHAEEPTADMSMLPFFMVAGLARKHVPIALSGEGADEIFAGYETYQASSLAQHYKALPKGLRSALRNRLRLVKDRETHLGWWEKARRFTAGAEAEGDQVHLMWRNICNADLRAELLLRREQTPMDPPGWEGQAGSDEDPLRRWQYLDLTHYLPNDLLIKADRMSMAHGLEVRVPYLDHEMVELGYSLPASVKLRHLRHRKWVLRQIADRVVPIKLPRRKRGFNIPFSAWVRGPLREFVQDTLAEDRLKNHGILNPRVVADLLRDHLSGLDKSYELHNLLSVTLWMDIIHNGPRPSPENEPESAPVAASHLSEGR